MRFGTAALFLTAAGLAPGATGQTDTSQPASAGEIAALLAFCDANPQATMCAGQAGVTTSANWCADSSWAPYRESSAATLFAEVLAGGRCWQAGSDPCVDEWKGVTCASGAVTGVEIGGSITVIPAAIASLFHLERLHLGINRIVDIPYTQVHALGLSDLCVPPRKAVRRRPVCFHSDVGAAAARVYFEKRMWL